MSLHTYGGFVVSNRVYPDEQQLRALAHPVRVSLLGLLRVDGPGTASMLAVRLGISSGLASYHLRALGSAGFIAEDVDRGTTRERWWKAQHEVTVIESVDSVPSSPHDRDLADVFGRRWDTGRNVAESQWSARRVEWPERWLRARDRSDWLLRVTPDEAAEAMAAIGSALQPFFEQSLRRRDGIEPMPDDAHFVGLFASMVPVADIGQVLSILAGLDDLEHDPGEDPESRPDPESR